ITQLKKAADGATELRKSLQEEHDRAEALASELATARQDLKTQLALSSKAGDETENQAADSATTELRKSLQQEHDRAEALTSELATARQDLKAQLAFSGKTADEITQLKKGTDSAAAELQKSLQREHDRAEALNSELARTRRDLATQVALSSKAG